MFHQSDWSPIYSSSLSGVQRGISTDVLFPPATCNNTRSHRLLAKISRFAAACAVSAQGQKSAFGVWLCHFEIDKYFESLSSELNAVLVLATEYLASTTVDDGRPSLIHVRNPHLRCVPRLQEVRKSTRWH